MMQDILGPSYALSISDVSVLDQLSGEDEESKEVQVKAHEFLDSLPKRFKYSLTIIHDPARKQTIVDTLKTIPKKHRKVILGILSDFLRDDQ